MVANGRIFDANPSCARHLTRLTIPSAEVPGSIVFRTYRVTFTEEDLRTGIADAEYQVTVEVDQVDADSREGWVVLVRGTAHHIATAAERASIGHVGLKAWVDGEPEHLIRVDPIQLRGQRIRSA
jgi:hypothetical protein